MHLGKSKFHFVGIGGIGMCGLAELMHNIGAKVTGSDLSENANTERLKALGIPIFLGHSAQNVGEVDVVVFSSAVKEDNPEVIAARSKKIPLIPRAEALAELMRLKRGIAIAGTHGKTTTTSMLASLFINANSKPTIVVGGRLDLIQSTALLGDGEWLLAEADESDGSFSKLSPEIAIITNIDSDHLDHYKTLENVRSAFHHFGLKVPFYGALIVWGDEPATKKLFENFPKNVLFYGFDPGNDYVISGEKGSYQVSHDGKILGRYQVPVPGKHNALNAMAAILAGMRAGFSFEVCAAGIHSFKGVDRRFQWKGEKSGIAVYDDYGHHPTEVKATLQAFKEKFPDRRVVVYFQPHRYSRTQLCWDDFLTCFHQADHLLLGDIYAAGEKPIPGIDAETLFKSIQHSSKARLPKSEKMTADILGQLKKGDVFLTLGAGDGWKLGMDLLSKL